MNILVSFEDLETMNKNLRYYDVVQGGWQHESKGADFSLMHCLSELVRAQSKNFFDSRTTQKVLAPDSMHFALRIARWTRFPEEEVIPNEQTRKSVMAHKRLWMTPLRIGAYSLAETNLAQYVHDLAEPEIELAARESRHDKLSEVSRALMYFALQSAEEFVFDPITAFNDRLADLRHKKGIVQP